MISATYSMAQMFALIVPGLIMFLITKDYFGETSEIWNKLVDPNHELAVVVIPILFIAIANGLIIQGLAYIISNKVFVSGPLAGRLGGGQPQGVSGRSLGRMIKHLDGDQMNVLRSSYYLHQTMLSLFIVLVIALVQLLVSPKPLPTVLAGGPDIRIELISIFCVITGYASSVSFKSVMMMYHAIDQQLEFEETQRIESEDEALPADLPDSAHVAERS